MKEIRLEQHAAAQLLPPRPADGAKWTFGRVLLVCGCRAMSGAALMSGAAAIRSGVGLAQLGCVPAVADAMRQRCPEFLLLSLSEETATGQGALSAEALPRLLAAAEQATAVLFGCGVSRCGDTRALLAGLVREVACPLVLDADGLNLLAEEPALLQRRGGQTILTPHMGEFARLCGQTQEAVLPRREALAAEFARRYGVTLALKGAETLITDGDVLWRYCRPNSGMAKGGSGDTLAGLIAGLTAQGIPPVQAAALGVFLHGEAGAYARMEKGTYAMLPTDVQDCLPRAFLALERLAGAKSAL